MNVCEIDNQKKGKYIMSLARKCNRCKQFFDPLDSPGRMARFENPIFQTSNEIREQVRGEMLDELAGPDGIIDLCPTCSVLFRDLNVFE